MKIKLFVLLTMLAAGLAVTHRAAAQGTAFTYQGRLDDGGNPANGTYNLTFSLFTTNTGGTAVAGPVTNSAVAVSNGLFTVIIDFGAGVWNGETNWLQIGVETNGGSAFTALIPRQWVTPVPYAIFAENLGGTVPGGGLSGTYGNPLTLNNVANQFSGNFTGNFTGTHSGNGGGLTNVNASTLNGVLAGNFWQLTGNNVGGGEFLGSLNNQAVDLRANNQRAFRLEPTATADSPNVIGGSAFNSTANAISATISGGYLNSIAAGISDASIGGGVQNAITGAASDSTIGGGIGNSVSGVGSFIGGGGSDGTTSPGNQVQAGAATIGGGMGNQIQSGAFYAFIGGGNINSNAGNAAAISGGLNNTIQSGANDASIAGGQNNLVDTHSAAVIFYNGQPFLGAWSAVGGGLANTIQSAGSLIGGGFYNVVDTNSTFPVVFSNGQLNNGGWSVVAGGAQNTNSAGAAFIGGGGFNWIQANAPWSFIGGGEANVIDTNSNVSSLGDYGVVSLNNLSGGFSFIGGGAKNEIRTDTSVIGGGAGNVIDLDASVSFIGGGVVNSISNSFYSFIGGGVNNFIKPNSGTGESTYSTIGGGGGNKILAASGGGFIGGGSGNTISTNGVLAAIAGGSDNTADGGNAAIPGGYNNVASGEFSFAAGSGAMATNDYSFVWSDGAGNGGFGNGTAASTAPHQFIIGAAGGVAINTHPNTNTYAAGPENYPYNLTVAYGISADHLDAGSIEGGAITCDSIIANDLLVYGDGTFTNNVNCYSLTCPNINQPSDLNLKEHFTQINAQEVLARVAAIPITQWNFKADAATRHIGPMAQDFYAAFNVGPDERHITTVDEGGVALAAIQGLNQKVEDRSQELEARSRKLEAENAELKQRLEALERIVLNLKSN